MNKVTFNADLCKGCGLCIEACPKKIIALDESCLNAKGFHPVAVKEMEKCLGCAMCATMCPDVVITVYKEEK